MPPLITQGLILSALGLGLTFAALGVFIFVILGLQRVFASRPAPAEPAPAPPAPDSLTGRDPAAEEIAAAIVIALSHLRSRELCESGLGEALTAGRGPYGRPAATAQPRPPRSQS